MDRAPTQSQRATGLRRWGRAGPALFLVLALLAACATRGQVEAIVAESNAALVSPYVDVPGETTGDWQESVQDIDRFIDAHEDNATLVNHLRVRQAMILTAHGKRNLADQYWGLVQRDALNSDRDRSLYDTGRHLSWWYQAAPDAARIDGDEADAARSALSTAIASTAEGSDIRTYLSTIRAQLELRMARDSHLAAPATELPAALERYIDAVGADEGWITSLESLSSQDLASARAIKAFRYRIWLRELIQAYRQTALDLELPSDQVDWRPDWVDRVG